MSDPIPEYRIPSDCDEPIDPPSYMRAAITQGQFARLLTKIKEARVILCKSRNVGTTAKERNIAALEAENILEEAIEGIK